MSASSRTVEPAARPLKGRIVVPGDKSIAHRAVLFNAAARGVATVRGLPDGADVASTLGAMAALGCRVDRTSVGEVVIEGRDFRFAEPASAIDCGNSGTTMRLLMGLLAGQDFRAVLDGDASLRRRPMERVAKPLRSMGAEIATTDGRAPVTVRGRALTASAHGMTVASAQVKTALLLAALQARGQSEIREPAATRDHSERMLRAMGAPIATSNARITVDGPGRLATIDVDVCGDASSAAFFAVAGTIVGESRLVIERVCLNPTRLGFVAILRRMGGRIEIIERGENAGEPFGDLVVEAVPLVGTAIAAEEIPACIDELPVLAVAAATAEGRTTIEGAEELRVKESDRIATVAALLRAWGIAVDERPGGMLIDGIACVRGRRFRGNVKVDSHGDHRIAMAAAVGALVADGCVTIANADAAVVSFPRFFETLAEAHA